MKKTARLILAILCAGLLFTACNNVDTPVDTSKTTDGTEAVTEPSTPVVLPTAAELANTVASLCTFTEELMPNQNYLAHHLFDFASLSDRYTDCAAYVPVGITPQEVLVFIATDDESAKILCDKLEAYVDYQASEYGDYKPSEVPKLDGTVIEREGTVVVYVVSNNNDAAADVVENVLRPTK